MDKKENTSFDTKSKSVNVRAYRRSDLSPVSNENE